MLGYLITMCPTSNLSQLFELSFNSQPISMVTFFAHILLATEQNKMETKRHYTDPCKVILSACNVFS